MAGVLHWCRHGRNRRHPVAMLLIKYVTGPLDLPVVVSNTAAMSVGSALTS